MAEERHDHIVPIGIYVAVLVTLLVLLALTLVAAFYDLDQKFHAPYWNMAIAVFVAICKAFLIVLFFMHVKYGTRVIWAFAGAGFVWLGIMMTLSLSDYITRENPPGMPTYSEQRGMGIERPPQQHHEVVPGASIQSPRSRIPIAMSSDPAHNGSP